MTEYTSETWEDALDRSNREPVVVLFHASWCGPCRGFKPVVQGLAAELGFYLAGVDAGVNRDVAARYGIRSVPAVLVLKDGAAAESPRMGAASAEQLHSYLAAAGVPSIRKA